MKINLVKLDIISLMRNDDTILVTPFEESTLALNTSNSFKVRRLDTEKTKIRAFDDRPTDVPIPISGFYSEYIQFPSLKRSRLVYCQTDAGPLIGINDTFFSDLSVKIESVRSFSRFFKFVLHTPEGKKSSTALMSLTNDLFISSWFTDDEKSPIRLMVNVLENESLKQKYATKITSGSFNLTEFVFDSRHHYETVDRL